LSAAVQHSAEGEAAGGILAAGDLRVSVALAMGGRIGRFWRETAGGPQHILVPLQSQVDFDPYAWPKAGCYPLTPFSNRIRDGRFVFRGREVRLPAHPGTPDALHGFAQQRPWSLEPVGPGELVMRYDHASDAWPWAFRATQRLRLAPDALEIAVAVENRSGEAMPVGLGLHPYLVASPGDRIRFETDWAWDIDERFVATARRPQTAARRVHDAPHGTDGATEYLSGWSGTATIERGDGVTVTLSASPELDHVVFHVPPGGLYACIEPVSHVADAFNLAPAGHEGTGLRVLAPGEVVEATLRIGIG
jgi:aldose 1-epimerase